jgi:hypothetical protein
VEENVRKIGSFGKSGENTKRNGPLCFSTGGFSLHANVVVEKREVLEKVCRYITRPPIAESRLDQNRDIE